MIIKKCINLHLECIIMHKLINDVIMKNKRERLLTIKKIIESSTLSSQEELLVKVSEKGFDVTQATLSRDLKALNITKVVDKKGGYKYVLTKSLNKTAPVAQNNRSILEGFVSINFSGNFAVIKTLPAHANGIASLIDSFELYEVLGTVAGDDTILVIPMDSISRSSLLEALLSKMPEIKKKVQ